MKVIGITGGIGCGKSEVLKFLKSLGAYVIEADKLAHILMKSGNTLYDKIISEFGNDIIGTDNEIDRTILGKKVFSDENALIKLNMIVHPAVKEYILQDIKDKKISGNIDFYFIEAALLIQDGYRNICDEIWYIYADRDVRLMRLVNGRGGDKSKYISVMDNQESEDFYRDNCDIVIDNNGNFEKTQNVLNDLLNKSI